MGAPLVLLALGVVLLAPVGVAAFSPEPQSPLPGLLDGLVEGIGGALAGVPSGTGAAVKGWSLLGGISPSAASVCGAYASASNTAYCWGQQAVAAAAAADGSTDLQTPAVGLANFSAPMPVSVAVPVAWRALASGRHAAADAADGAADVWSCGIRYNGALSCWGTDSSGLGLLGTGVAGASQAQPALVDQPAGASWAALDVGGSFSCAARADDSSLWCWGSNAHGALGCGQLPGGATFAPNPCRVNSSELWLAVATGGSAACAISSNGTLFCWGLLAAGGSGQQAASFASPQAVPGTNDVSQVSVGIDEVCYLQGNAAFCFPLAAWPPVPAPVNDGDGWGGSWAQVSVGADHKCGVTVAGRLKCWGANAAGQCGVGRDSAKVARPTLIDLPNNRETLFSDVQAGAGFTCASTNLGELLCWGGGAAGASTFGQLGDGTFSSSSAPVRVVNPGPGPPPAPPSPSPPPPPPPPSPSPPPPPPPQTSGSGVPVGAIVGGVVGGVAVLLAGAGALLLHMRRRRSATQPLDAEQALKGLKGGSPQGQRGPQALGGKGHQVEELELMRRQRAGAGAIAAAAAGSSGGESDPLKSDELLTWISSHPPPATPSLDGSGGCGGTPLSATSAGGSVGGSSVASAASSVMPRGGASPSSAGGSAKYLRNGSGAYSRAGSGLVDIRPFALTFSDLRIERCIGQGSFGKVYLASYNETPVAVKILMKLEAAEDDEELHPVTLSSPALAGLNKEAEVMAALRHPNVVSLMGVCSYPPALVTEYCSRGSLTDVLSEARRDHSAAAHLAWPLRLHLALDAAKGMLALHAHNPQILHRDLKSPNLLVDFSWRVKVTDFNLSAILEQGETMSSTSPVNPRWLAPEILRGAKATAASDLFSFGVVLWELLTWEVPWSGVDFWEIVAALLGGERLPVPAREALPGADTPGFAGLDAYCQLMQRCQSGEPADRPTFLEIIPQLRLLLDQAA
ncbi:Serine threonine-kinase CTR1 [Micractinium conductrix]|uniref:Serine threonine-kinase CTR1 n=1 Tax=Micractinium conductrix TaxID=554055 RepID=A0A2P6V5B3_9CHLO|nr:Serine threonine-kinase CTR1 [Micractinium conductrix]|eukprot:PSC69274.1 Serine threonine-kinase CTR1 [Micractinium conductrix]